MSGLTTATYPTLYSKDSMSRIRIWYMQQDLQNYRTISGLQDGEKVTSEWTEAKAKNIGKKNEKKPIDQATEEVQSRYKKQKKTGYFDKVEDVDKMGYVECMLAHQYKNYIDDIDFTKREWGIQRKLNGNRCIATRNGLFTRKGEKYVSVPHIEEALKSYFKANPDAVLDGELYNYELRQKLNELSSLVRKTKNISQADLDKSKEIVQYWIYDGYGFLNLQEDSKYDIRHACLSSLDKDYKELGFIKVLPHFLISSEEQFNSLYNEFVEDGEEGAILRKLKSAYEHKRSKYLLKVKPEDSTEATITACHYGKKGNWRYVIKTFSLDWNGVLFDATLKCSKEEAEIVTNNQEKWVGRKVTFLYNGLTGIGTPNFARVDILNCEPST